MCRIGLLFKTKNDLIIGPTLVTTNLAPLNFKFLSDNKFIYTKPKLISPSMTQLEAEV